STALMNSYGALTRVTRPHRAVRWVAFVSAIALFTIGSVWQLRSRGGGGNPDAIVAQPSVTPRPLISPAERSQGGAPPTETARIAEPATPILYPMPPAPARTPESRRDTNSGQ